MGTALGLIIPALPGLIKLVEQRFSRQGAGDSKKSTVLEMARSLLTKLLSDSGQGTTNQPTDAELSTVIETVFTQLKSTGQLTSAPATGEMFLVIGTVTPLTKSQSF